MGLDSGINLKDEAADKFISLNNLFISSEISNLHEVKGAPALAGKV
jgi:hypothetical protein